MLILYFVIIFVLSNSFCVNKNRYIEITVEYLNETKTLSCILGTNVNDVLNILNIENNKLSLNYSLDYTLKNNDLILIDSKRKININTDPKTELMELYGVGDTIAENIIEYRNRYDGFKSIDELKEVKGIGESKYEKNKENISL